MPKVEVVSRRQVFDDVFKIEEARLRYERYDGAMSQIVRRLSFERSDSTAALVVNARSRRVYLTEQFRFPTLDKSGGWIVEIVAGTIEAGEAPEPALRRETLEEIGFEIEAIEPIGSFFVSPGGTSERIFLFCAMVSDAGRKSAGGGIEAEGENIRMVEWTIEEFLAKLAAGQLQDAKTIVAAYWLKENLPRIR